MKKYGAFLEGQKSVHLMPRLKSRCCFGRALEILFILKLMADAKVFERAAVEADTLATELGSLRKENYKLRDEIERYIEHLIENCS